jgi:tetratricopeptide (TPR) repeat protein
MTRQLDGQALQLNDQLSSLQKEIVAKQEELLRLQQSIQAESVRLAQVTTQRGAAPSPAKSTANRAYDLDRQGLQLYKEKQYPQAEQKFKAAVALKPRDPVLLNNLGYIYYVMGRNDQALTYLEKTLSLDPRRKEAQGNIAELYLKLGRREEAKKHYEAYLTLYPASPKAEEFRRILQSLN